MDSNSNQSQNASFETQQNLEETEYQTKSKPDYSNLKQTAKVTQGKNRFPPATMGDLRRNPQRHLEKCVLLLEEYDSCRKNIINSFMGQCQNAFKMVNACLGEEFEYHRRQNKLKGKNTRVLLDTLREQRKEHRWKEMARQGEEVVSWNSMSEQLLMDSKRSMLRQEFEYYSHDDIKGYDWNKYVENLEKKDDEIRKEFGEVNKI